MLITILLVSCDKGSGDMGDMTMRILLDDKTSSDLTSITLIQYNDQLFKKLNIEVTESDSIVIIPEDLLIKARIASRSRPKETQHGFKLMESGPVKIDLVEVETGERTQLLYMDLEPGYYALELHKKEPPRAFYWLEVSIFSSGDHTQIYLDE